MCDIVTLPDYFYNLLYIIDLIDLERDLWNNGNGDEKRDWGDGGGGYSY